MACLKRLTVRWLEVHQRGGRLIYGGLGHGEGPQSVEVWNAHSKHLQRHRHRDTETDTQTQTQRQTQRHRHTDTETDTETQTQTQSHRDRHRDTENQLLVLEINFRTLDIGGDTSSPSMPNIRPCVSVLSNTYLIFNVMPLYCITLTPYWHLSEFIISLFGA